VVTLAFTASGGGKPGDQGLVEACWGAAGQAERELQRRLVWKTGAPTLGKNLELLFCVLTFWPCIFVGAGGRVPDPDLGVWMNMGTPVRGRGGLGH
jgi:hypothetical protein